jgi:hypothetical protein
MRWNVPLSHPLATLIVVKLCNFRLCLDADAADFRPDIEGSRPVNSMPSGSDVISTN